MIHYVYKVTDIETGQFYIGSRSTKLNSELDDYLGSWKVWKPKVANLRKEILKDDFNCREDAMKFEAEEITKVINDPLNENYHIPGIGYCVNGRVTVKDKNGKHYSVAIDDPRYLSGEFVMMNKDMVTVKDTNGNVFQVSVFDERYLSGEVMFIQKGYKHTDKALDKIKEKRAVQIIGNRKEETKKKISNKNKLKRGNETSCYNTRWIFNPLTNEKKRIKKDESVPNDWIEGSGSGRIWIINIETKKRKLIRKDEQLPDGWEHTKKV
ncbi:MAG: hypothetical protein WC979_00090 [Candidatus Pacearchaeota archaeon]|jgi:hypothetical protein|nr:hypothetical protein [Clostridia bacterium]